MKFKLLQWCRAFPRRLKKLCRAWKLRRHLAVSYSLRTSIELSDTLILLHIPKTAGTTLRNLMRVICLTENMSNLRIAVTTFDPPVLITHGWQGAWANIPTYRAEELSECRFISGHFPFGIHTKIPLTSSYITLLREPVDREISSFNYHYQLGHFKKGDSLENVLQKKQLMDNPQTRMIAGEQHCLEDRCSELTFIQAKENLRSKFLIVGVTDEFNEFLCALLALQGWPAVEYSQQRVTGLKLIHDISESTRKELEEFHHYDVELYKYVKENWKTWVSEYVDFEQRRTGKQPVLHIPWHYDFSHRYSLSNRDLGKKQIR